MEKKRGENMLFFSLCLVEGKFKEKENRREIIFFCLVEQKSGKKEKLMN